MGYNLTIDQGNTAVKAVLWEDRRNVDAATLAGEFSVDGILSFLDGRIPDATIACSVNADTAVTAAALREAGLQRVMEMRPCTPVPIANDYRTPLTLGADRIAAAVGAMDLRPGEDLLIADLGTACTYDVVTADGHFAGGNIAPGIGMRLRALNRFTSRLPEVSSRGDIEPIGTCTESAMRSGAVYGVVAEIELYRTLNSATPRTVILAGGWASRISPLLRDRGTEVIETKYLVNQGLNSILLYNESI